MEAEATATAAAAGQFTRAHRPRRFLMLLQADSRCRSSVETHASVVCVPVQDVEGNSRAPLTAAGMCRLVAVAALLGVFLRKVSPRERPERSGPRLSALPHALPGEGRRG